MYFALNLHKLDKFQFKSIPIIHMVYVQNTNGYIFYNLKDSHFFLSIDAIFKESVFPFNGLLLLSGKHSFLMVALLVSLIVQPHQLSATILIGTNIHFAFVDHDMFSTSDGSFSGYNLGSTIILVMALFFFHLLLSLPSL